MALDRFDFPFHGMPETKNPESGVRGQFGGSYVFTAPPSDPDQRIITLNFPAMKFFFDSFGAIDAATNSQYNMKALINFYQAHKLHQSFIYPHPVYGDMEVKFYKPLEEPSTIPNSGGVTKEFEVQLIEIP